MIEKMGPLNGLRDKAKWTARGASLMAKAKATKVVWFPPKPVETGKKAASRAKKATSDTGRKSASRAKKATSGTGRKAASTAKKATSGTKKVTNPVRRKKT